MSISKLVVIVLLLISFIANSQYKTENNNLHLNYTDIPQEKVFIHFNTALLFSGEYLYYNIYCINSKTNTLSKLSKIAYVELIGEDLKPVFKHKLKLNNGVGFGDFFLPVSIPSGNYKLIGYTQWMNNKLDNNFFQNDISIINPYQSNQKSILADVNMSENIKEIGSANNSKDKQHNKDTYIKLKLNKEKFFKREHVQLTLKNVRGKIGFGNYSISVKKLYDINVADRYTTKTFNSLYKSEKHKNNHEIILPELRGELIFGKITAIDSSALISNKKVAMSIPGENYDLKIATANDKGVFYFNLDKENNEENALLQVLGNKERYTIEIYNPKPPDYANLTFHTFCLKPEMKSTILERSVYNQISNGFFSIKPDTLKVSEGKSRFYGDKAKVFDLDDYTRFPTIRETLVEIVDNVWIKKIDKEKYVFQVRSYNPSPEDLVFLPLVIIDGVMIQDHSTIVDYNANKIKRIKLIRDLYFLNSQMFQGIIDIETIDGDYFESVREKGVYSTQLSKPLAVKKYYQEKYDTTTKETTLHIPDYRQQLLWKPNVRVDKDEMVIDFFTSDNTGTFEISLEGFTDMGDAVSIHQTLEVE